MDGDFDESAWRDRLRTHREEKDDFLAGHPQSPIPDGEREAFSGLEYFDLDPAYRVLARFERAHSPDVEKLASTRGPPQSYERVGVFGFELDGDHHTLAAFRVEGAESLFVPFTDETNGDETYRQGRYLDVDAAGADDRETVALDFNLAYSPFCAYDDNFSCALPPAENELDVEVRAGERG